MTISPALPFGDGGVELPAPASATRRSSLTTLRRLMRHPTGGPSLIFLLLVVVAVAAAPLLAPFGPENQDLLQVLSGPTSRHLLGTDDLGRDILSRLLYGGGVTLEGVAETVSVALVLGLVLGIVAGYRGGAADAGLSKVVEVVMAIPAIVVLLMVFSLFNNDENWAMITLGLLSAPAIFRVARGAALSVRNDGYVAAAKVSGVSELKIMKRHVAPRIYGPVIVNASVLAGVALGVQCGLNFIGLGVTPPAPSWGGMIADAEQNMQEQAWLIVPAGLAVALTILAFVLLGDALRDIVSEKSSGRSRSRGRSVSQPPAPAPASFAPPGTTAPLLSLRGLSVVFGDKIGAVRVVQDVGFDIAPGEAVGLLGESGCGKSVTTLALLGLLGRDGRVTSGTCDYQGRDLFVMTAKQRAALRGREIAYVSQEPMTSLDPCYNVGSQLAELVRTHEPTLGRNQVHQRVIELLSQVGLPSPEDVARRYPHQVSGGMAQRVCIAAALAGRPKLLVADEPTTALDVTVQAEILELLRRLRAETGMAVLIITHDLGVVADLCDRAVVMYAGEVVEMADINQLTTYPAHPYTQALLASNPVFAEPGGQLPSIAGTVTPPQRWPVGCHFADRCPYRAEQCVVAPVPLEAVGQDRLTRCVRHAEIMSVAAK